MSRDPFFEMLEARDPSPLLHQLRASDPVHRVEPLGFWLVTRHDDVKSLLHRPDDVTHDKRQWERHVPAEPGTLLRWFEDHSLFAVAPEDHTRLRRLVSAAFTPRAVRRMEAQVREVIEAVAAPLRGRHGEVLDLMGEFTNIVPNTVISRLTGVPPGNDEVRFRELAQSVIAAFLPFVPPELKEQANAGFVELAGWVRELCRKRLHDPREDMVTDLVHARDQDARLSEDDVVLMLAGIVGAGSETTALGGAAILRMLLDQPATMERLRADRGLIFSAIDEIIRFTMVSPGGTIRFAVRDFDLRGEKICKGDMLMLSMGGANHDPAIYENPDVLDLDRDVKDLLNFGNGPHYCLGANLARQEMGCMLDALLDIVPPGSRAREDLFEVQDSGTFKRPLNLPVEIGPPA